MAAEILSADDELMGGKDVEVLGLPEAGVRMTIEAGVILENGEGGKRFLVVVETLELREEGYERVFPSSMGGVLLVILNVVRTFFSNTSSQLTLSSPS